jgi:hypothetical protein
MIEITKKLPITLIEILNNFNEELSNFRRDVEMKSDIGEIRLNSTKYERVNIRYLLKNTSFYFEINFVLEGDFIDWNFYPHRQDSTKKYSRARIGVTSNVYSELKNALTNWKKIITNISQLKNPLEYFDSDNFIEFYSGEILEQIPTTEEEEKYPLSSAKRKLAIELIDKQTKFIKKELSAVKDVNSDKYYDLLLAEKNLNELKEDLPRMTVAEVKRKWSISLGVIIKWCSGKFIKFTKMDGVSGHDISRTIGSFIGGVFGIPKIDQ